MPRLYRKKARVGLPPGSLHRENDDGNVILNVIDFSEKVFSEYDALSIQDTFKYRDTDTVSWINIFGTNVETIKQIGKHYGVHQLVLEDIINRGQRPKVEDYDNYLFFVLKMISFDPEINDIYAEQVCVILGEGFVISVQEKEGDVFDEIRDRIRGSKGRIRKMGADYLAYALLDAIVDHYFVVLERLGEKIDTLENEVLKEPKSKMPMEIYKLKTEVIYLRKQIWPLREVLANFQRTESSLIDRSTHIFLRDVYDHTIQINDTIEAFRDAISGLHDIYLSSVSNRMNEIMKVLTIFSAIFIPLTFIAGIYGMNFDHIPELHFKNGYFIALGFMATLGIGMGFYFKNKKWL